MSRPTPLSLPRACAPVLYLALELAWSSWKLAFTVGSAQKPRIRSIRARDTDGLMKEISSAKKRFGLPPRRLVISCYEAGREWFLVASIPDEQRRPEHRRRRCLDRGQPTFAPSQIGQPGRGEAGGHADPLAQREKKLWAVVRVPTVEDEDHREPHRELIELKTGRTEVVNRIKGLLAGLGLPITVDDILPSAFGRSPSVE